MRKRWAIGLAGLLGLSALLSDPAAAELGRNPAKNHPPKISNKYNEYKRVVKFFIHNDGQLDSKEREVLQRLEERFQISPEEASQIARDIAVSLGHSIK
ncbi:MAG: hypothetical protein HYY20_13625 [Candidatus Tectomicrobia bacterium]|uniref:Co-chaperone DjlA N-terminal domain-containing protein n=1 Tax=Tectimicrobiota bacterium TaxID=2528274 RepID=A0A932CQY2_UNCTE|nr:hypothetical protein [Candidatus Tectomicrobia bacterium]